MIYYYDTLYVSRDYLVAQNYSRNILKPNKFNSLWNMASQVSGGYTSLRLILILRV